MTASTTISPRRDPQRVYMQYLGAARLLVETHNKYLRRRYSPDLEQDDCMDAFVNDFNETAAIHVIIPTGGGQYGVFDREGV